MLASSVPYKFTYTWGSSAGAGYINATIPTMASGGAASQALGFPPATDTPAGSGGVPPSIKDFNGVLKYETAWSQWMQSGGPIGYDAAFSTAIGGYPSGAFLWSASGTHHWTSTTDNNTTDPDTGGAGWVQLYALLAGWTSGAPVAPTAAPGTNTTQIASTAFVIANGTPIATQAATQAGISTTTAVSPAGLAATMLLGAGGQWNSYSSPARVLGTTYTAPAYPIALNVFGLSSYGSQSIICTMGNGTILYGGGQQNPGNGMTLSVVIPANQTYNVTLAGGTIASWSETR